MNILEKISETYSSIAQTPPQPWRPSNFGVMDEAVPTAQLPRVFLNCANSVLIANDPIYTNAFSIKPDFPLVEGRVVHPTGKRPLWRQCPSFLEVKAHDTDSPIPAEIVALSLTDLPPEADGETPYGARPDERPPRTGDTLIRRAEYARAILSCRPFQLSVFGLLLWGTDFAVASFDRRGAVLSPTHNILEQDGLRAFVRVVLRMTWEMSGAELGRDPTVERATEDVFDESEPPRFTVGTARSDNADQERWLTIGRPLWCSPALSGRGTSVWWAVDAQKNPVILKTSWRNPNRAHKLQLNTLRRGIILLRKNTGYAEGVS